VCGSFFWFLIFLTWILFLACFAAFLVAFCFVFLIFWDFGFVLLLLSALFFGHCVLLGWLQAFCAKNKCWHHPEQTIQPQPHKNRAHFWFWGRGSQEETLSIRRVAQTSTTFHLPLLSEIKPKLFKMMPNWNSNWAGESTAASIPLALGSLPKNVPNVLGKLKEHPVPWDCWPWTWVSSVLSPVKCFWTAHEHLLFLFSGRISFCALFECICTAFGERNGDAWKPFDGAVLQTKKGAPAKMFKNLLMELYLELLSKKVQSLQVKLATTRNLI